MKKRIKTNNKKNFVNLIVIIDLLLATSIICFFCYKKVIGKEFINYQETSSLDYTVCFEQPNDFYEQECLPENINSYVTKYIEKININFKYKLNFNKELDIKYEYSIKGELTIFDRNNNANIMNRKRYTFVENKTFTTNNTEEITVIEKIKIDYETYDQFVKDYKSNANVRANANLKLIFNIKSSSMFGDISDSISASNDLILNIPLDESTIQLNASYKPNNQSPNILIQTNQSSLNNIFKILSFLTGSLSLILLFILIKSLIKQYKNRSLYDKQVSKLKKEYDADITNIKELIGTNKEKEYIFFDVPDFKELYEEVKKNNDKHIYWNEKIYYDEDGGVKNRISWFILFLAEKKVVRFIINENELIRKNQNNSKYKKDEGDKDD